MSGGVSSALSWWCIVDDSSKQGVGSEEGERKGG